MSAKTHIGGALYEYMRSVSVREPDVLRRLREETSGLPGAGMQIAPDQGQLLRLLVQIIGARKALEIGVFTGYSALCVAMALPADGKLVACDISEEWTAIARRYWKEALVADKIDLRLAPALETLAALVRDGHCESFDFAFVDAAKHEYQDYFEYVLKLLRTGATMMVDNVLWGGNVIDQEKNDADTVAIREFNKKLHDDSRVDICMLAVGDGVTLARKI